MLSIIQQGNIDINGNKINSSRFRSIQNPGTTNNNHNINYNV